MARPYWLDFDKHLVLRCACAFVLATGRLPFSDVAGSASVDPDAEMQELLIDMSYQPPKGRDVETTELGVSAGL